MLSSFTIMEKLKLRDINFPMQQVRVGLILVQFQSTAVWRSDATSALGRT